MKNADLLKPYAIHVAGIHAAISALSDDELTKLVVASESATQTNCWWATYQAAKLIGPEIRREIEARRSAAEATLAKTKRTDIAPGCGDAGERANTDGRLEFMPFYIEQKLNLIERLRHEATNFGGIQSNVGELLKEAAEWIVGGET